MINKELLAFLEELPDFSAEEKALLAENIPVASPAKGTILLHEGAYSNACYFILKGCIRQYFIVDGIEKTTAFFTEGQPAVSFAHYGKNIPSDHYLACIEDSVVIVGQVEKEQEMYEKMPKLVQLTRSMMEADYGKTQSHLTNFITSSPEERYRQLLAQRPGLLDRAPQHQIASYLGITPESLSRIRKRIASKK